MNKAAQNGTFVAVTYQSMGTEYTAIDGDEALVVLDYAELSRHRRCRDGR